MCDRISWQKLGAVANRLEFGSAIALVAFDAVALPNPSWLTVRVHCTVQCALYVASPYFCRIWRTVARLNTLLRLSASEDGCDVFSF